MLIASISVKRSPGWAVTCRCFSDVLEGKEAETREPMGRKLDFILQEMFRETNTIGSKAADAEISSHVVEIKCAIERMRELVQNLE